MKPIYAHAAGAVALTFAIAACVPAPDSTPAPSPTPVVVAPTPSPTPTPVAAAPAFENWIDAPQTQGNWTYTREEVGPTRNLYTSATFRDSRGDTLFHMTCSPTQQILLGRHIRSVGDVTLTVRTESATSGLVAPRDPEGRNLNTAVINASDPLLDAIALTRGRFAIEAVGHPTLYLPNWAEVTRVIEDCR